MNTTSCSVPPCQGKMFSSTPSSRTPVSRCPISSPNSRWSVSTAYSPNSTWPPSGRWNEPSGASDTSSAPSRGRLMTAIALMICSFALTALSYHADQISVALAWPDRKRKQKVLDDLHLIVQGSEAALDRPANRARYLPPDG